ncbi:MAG: CapA family protein [Cyanobacteriota bacterium]|nr:CapA family protein [Cyanobacteriota bacterium]
MKYRVLLGFGVGLVVFTAVWSQSLLLSSRKPKIPPKQTSLQSLTEKLPDSIRIKAVGDMVPGSNFPHYSLPGNPNQLFPSSVREKLRGSDLLFGNFESTITNHPYSTKDVSRGQVFAFRSPPQYAKLFAEVGFNVLSVANNHAMDFGKIGFQDTIDNIAGAGMKPVGKKNQILYLDVENIPVAVIGFCFYDYCNTVQDIDKAKAMVETARKKAKIVVISMHVGAEGNNALHVKNQTEFFYGENRGNSVQFARTMIDAGADLVLGHGPHVPRAIEVYQGKLIAYSLGNFLGYKVFSTSSFKGYSMILEAKLNPEGDFLSGKIIPVRLNKQAIPYIDQSFHTVGLLRSLNKSDFPNSSVEINGKGEILVNKKNQG